MNTVARPDSSAPPASSSDEGKSWIQRNLWALFDQGLMSASNFATMVLAARGLGVNAFGEFCLVYSVMLFGNTIQQGLVSQPHNVLASSRRGLDYARYTTVVALGQVGLAGVILLLSLIAAGWVWWMGWAIMPLILALAFTAPAWQLQEFVRRVLYTEQRTGAAFINDLVSYAGQVVLIALAYHEHRLTGVSTLYIIAGTSAVAVVLGIWQLRRSFVRHVDWNYLKENWQFGKWLLGAEALGWFVSLPMYQYVAAIYVGTAASGTMKAAQVLFGPMRVFAYFLCTILPIIFARTLASSGRRHMHDQLLRVLWFLTPALLVYCGAVAIFARPILHGVYGAEYAADSTILILYSISAFLGYSHMAFGAGLTASRNTRSIFISYLMGSMTAILLAVVLTSHMGLRGTIISMILTNVVMLLLFWTRYRNDMKIEENEEVEADRPMNLAPLPDRPLVSILLCNYNYEKFVGPAIQSVLDQSYPHWELIICDDGSTDGSAEIIRQYAQRDPRIKLIVQKNSGQAAAFNTAFQLAHGEIICTLDSDDTFYETKIEKIVGLMQARCGCGFAMHRLQVIDRDGRPIQVIPYMTRWEEGWIKSKIIQRGGRWRYMPSSALVFRKEVAERMFPIPEEMYRRSADAFLFTLAPLLTEVHILDEVAGGYRVHGDNGMSTMEFSQKSIFRVIDSIQRTLDGVNQRLETLPTARCRLDVNRHLNYHEYTFMMQLVEGDSILRLAPRYAGLMRMICQDDLYGLWQKFFAMPVFGVPLILPKKFRGKWLASVLGYNPVKQRLGKVLKRLRRRTETPEPNGRPQTAV